MTSSGASRPASAPQPWQTDTCIGTWHYSRAIAEQNRYKTVGQVVDMLLDIVSKNGNLMLSIAAPRRRHDRRRRTQDPGRAWPSGWAATAKAIHGTRPWRTFGEGPTQVGGGMFNENSLDYTARDMRFTTKDGNLYVYLLAKPAGAITVKSLASGAKHREAVADVTLLGSGEKLSWKQTDAGLVIEKPAKMPEQTVAAFKVRFE